MDTTPDTRSRRHLLRLAIACLGLAFCAAAHATNLRVVAYNIEADIGGVTTPRDGLYTVLEAIGQQSYAGIQQPIDVLALEETTSNAATVEPIVTALNAYYGAGTYAYASYQATQQGSSGSGNGPNALVYDTKTVSLLSQIGVPGTPSSSGALRQVVRYQLQPIGAPAATAFYVYVSHMKSSYGGTTPTVRAMRNAEAQCIRTDIGTLGAGANVLSVGDFNLDGSTEDAYQTLTTNGPLADPLNINPQNNNETWNTIAYKAIMTDSTSSLSYRDDLELMTPAVYTGTAPTGLHYVAGSCRTFGNNGTTTLGKSTNLSTNTSLNTNFNGPITASNTLSSLVSGSDHLPVVADYFVATPYATWQSQHFTAAQMANPAVTGDTADYDGDGIPNLLEYALQLDPTTANRGGLPTLGEMVVNGSEYQTLSYTQVIGATDVVYVAEVSSDLMTWQSGTNYLTTVSVTANADNLTNTVMVRDLASIDAGGPRFIRLRVNHP